MRRKNKILLLLIVASNLLFITCISQGNTKKRKTAVAAKNASPYRALAVGDYMPDFTVQLGNYTSATAKMSAFKGKYLILDFWATWCTSCLYNFPKLDSLQKELKNELQVLLVNTKDTKDDAKKVNAFFEKKRNTDGVKYNLPTIINDTVMNVLFPHEVIPHYVWVDKAGRVQAITSSDEVTNENIQSFTGGVSLQLREKKDIDFNSFEPLFVKGNGGMNENYLYRSFLTGYIDGLNGSVLGIGANENEIVSRIAIINCPILVIYKSAYPEMNNYPASKIILDVADIAKYKRPDKGEEWKRYTNTFTYEFLFPPTTVKKARAMMREDLKRYFGLKVYTEKRKVSCLILKYTGSPETLLAKPGIAADTNIGDNDNRPKYLLNFPLSVLTNYLNYVLTTPLIDESGITGNITMDNLPLNLSDVNSLRTALETYGFTLAAEQREVEFFILSENREE